MTSRSLLVAALVAATSFAWGQDFVVDGAAGIIDTDTQRDFENGGLLLPGQAWVEGSEDTEWLSELWLYNHGASDTVDVSFWPQRIDNSGAAVLTSLEVAGGSFIAVDDLLEGLGVAYGSVGTVVLAHESVHAEPSFLAASRTYNLTADGTFGQHIPPITLSKSAAAPMVLPGAQRSESFRCNLGLVNGGGSTATFAVSLLGHSSSFQVPPYSTDQLNDVFDKLAIDGNGLGTVVVSSDLTETGAYLSIIDNLTGDPSYLEPRTAVTDAYLTGCARGSGDLGTEWYTDLVISNQGNVAAEIDLRFLNNDQANTGPVPTADLTVAAGETVLLGDVVGNTIGSSGVGTVHLTASNEIYTWARTYNLDTSGEAPRSYGQTILPVTPQQMISAGSEYVFLFARGNDEFRSNVAAFNPGSTGGSLSLTAYDELGVQVGQETFTLEAVSGTQVNDVFQKLSMTNEVEVTIVATADVQTTGYLSMVDNSTGDAITVPPRLVSTGDCPEIEITDLQANPASITLGASITLSWILSTEPEAQTLDISGLGEVALTADQRSYTFTPTSTGAGTATLEVLKDCAVKTRTVSFEVAAASARAWQAAGFGGAGNFLNVAFDPAREDVAWAVSDVAGPLRSSDGGFTWASRAIGLGNYEVSSLAFDPGDTSALYAGSGALADSERRGLYRSTDEGATWSPLTSTAAPLVTFRKYRTVDAVAVDPSDSATVVTGSRAGGLWRSSDGGTTWAQVHVPPSTSVEPFNDDTVEDDTPTTPYPAPVSAVLFDEHGAGAALAAYDGVGLVSSTDHGATWQSIGSGLPNNPTIKSLARTGGGTLLAALGSAGVYLSNDGGSSWSAASQGLNLLAEEWVTSVLPHPVDADTALATVWTFDRSALWQSTDAGATWQPLLDVDPDEGTISNLTRDELHNPTGAWIGLYPEPAQRAAIDPNDGSRMLLATYWSLYGSSDGGSTWTERPAGAQGTCVAALAVDRAATVGQHDTVWAAQMDAGLLRSTDGGASWQPMLPVDWDETVAGHFWNVIVVDDGGATTVYATNDPWDGSNGQLFASRGGDDFEVVLTSPRPEGEWMGGAMLGLAVHPDDPARLYVTQDGGQVLHSGDRGASWAATSGQPDDSSFTYALAVDGDGSIFAGTLYSGLWRSTNGGNNWQSVLGPNDAVFHLEVAGSHVYATVGDGNLYRSGDGGETWTNLTNLQPTQWGDEVDDQGWSVAVDPADANHIVFGSQDSFHPADAGSGVLESFDGGATWTAINNGLGVRNASTLAFGSDGFLYAGTWCGGIWRLAPPVR